MATKDVARRRPILPYVVATVVVVGGLLALFAEVWTNRLWFGEVGFTSVFDTVLRTRLLLFLTFGLLMTIAVAANLFVAYRLRPPQRPNTLEQRSLDRYRGAIAPRRRLAFLGAALVPGLLAGLTAAGRWQTWLQWRNAVPFGVEDAQFGRDVGYFAFTYPFQRMVTGFLFAAVFLAIVGAAGVHYLYAGIRLHTTGDRIGHAARAHLSVLLGLFVALKAYAYYLDQYGLAFSPRGKVTGASYTDVNAELPALKILVVIAVICALLFFGAVLREGWTLPGLALVLMLLSSFAVGGAYPFVVQQVQVKPNEIERESPYIARNIAATRDAYRLREGTDVTYQRYEGTQTASARAVRADRDTVGNARLLDPNKLRATFESLQQIRGYYGFPEALDVDRYQIDGRTVTFIVGAREIDHAGLAPAQRNWINEHLVFTHGNGIVAAPTNIIDTQGNPRFAVRDIPPTGSIPVTQPRIYYGELAPSYSVVGTSQREVDRPAEGGGDADVTFTYDGKGGVGIGNLWRRLLFATKFRSRYLLLSGALKPESKILYVRDPRERVRKVAPYLELDQDPYPVVVGGRIVWVVDGYTTSNGYPYSERVALDQLTADAVRAGQTVRTINYIRNSVKATVDAYDGTVMLYRWDDADPVLKTWEKAFPGSLRPRSEMSADLLAHVRYPEDLFKIQRDLITAYHIDDPGAFFREADFWAVPNDPSLDQEQREKLGGPRPQPPYYQYTKLPGQTKPTFQLTTPLTARSRPNLAAYVSVSNDAADYGKITVLELPTNTSIPGPEQRGATFQTSPAASQELALLDQHGSEVVLGNLLTLPVGGTLVFVQPVYVQSTTGSQIPQLKRVFVGVHDRVGFADTFEAALDQAFDVTGSADPDPDPDPDPDEPDAPADVNAQIRRLTAEANDALQRGAAAFGRQDYAEYARQQERLRRALAELTRLTVGTASPSPGSSAPPGTPPP
ncbi:MAG TPA: UPF0182 family protein [Frankiaceae bacterium]|nr:UPF0182 family protein [Frankiaceae bacterium]